MDSNTQTIVGAAAAVPMVNSSTLLQAYSLLPGISAIASSDSSLTADSLPGIMYVQNANSSSISIVDLATNASLRNITVDGTPHNIKLSEDKLTFYILTSDRDYGTIFILNTTSNNLMINKIM